MQLGLKYRFDIRISEEIIFFCKRIYIYNLHRKIVPVSRRQETSGRKQPPTVDTNGNIVQALPVFRLV
jgi:hypothetical protein